jgi:hypothetical protein
VDRNVMTGCEEEGAYVRFERSTQFVATKVNVFYFLVVPAGRRISQVNAYSTSVCGLGEIRRSRGSCDGVV